MKRVDIYTICVPSTTNNHFGSWVILCVSAAEEVVHALFPAQQ